MSASITTKYRKFDELNYDELNEDEDFEKNYPYKDESPEERRMTIQELLLIQPPLIKPIEHYVNNPEIPAPDACHYHYWQMKESGWKQRCIDYKLAQVVRYSEEAKKYRELENARIRSELKKVQDESKLMTEIQNYQIIACEEASQHSKQLEKNLFADFVKPVLKRERSFEMGQKDSVDRTEGPSLDDFEKKMDEMSEF